MPIVSQSNYKVDSYICVSGQNEAESLFEHHPARVTLIVQYHPIGELRFGVTDKLLESRATASKNGQV